MMQHAVTGRALNYWLHHPADPPPAGTRHPLILYLHGAGERGADLDRVKAWGLPKWLDSQLDFPFIVVSPQCPEAHFWGDVADALFALIEEFVTQYDADPARLYATGFSMGGAGSMQLAYLSPDRFAAIAPVAGLWPDIADQIGPGATFIPDARIQAMSQPLRHTPMWAFHGTDDEAVDYRFSQKITDAVSAIGGEAKLTLYPGLNHGQAADAAFREEALYAWLLEHTRK